MAHRRDLDTTTNINRCTLDTLIRDGMNNWMTTPRAGETLRPGEPARRRSPAGLSLPAMFHP